jgi:hypothetical protein
VLSVSVGLLVLFLLVMLWHVIHLLSDVRQVTSKARDTIDLVNHYLWQPLKVLMMIMEKAKGFYGGTPNPVPKSAPKAAKAARKNKR